MKQKRIRLRSGREKLPSSGDESLDLIARKVIMTSVAYYGLGISIVTDDQFDKWCQKLNRLWFRLDPFRQWQLGSREEIKSTGFHIKVTQAAFGGLLSWLEEQGLKPRQITINKAWQRSKRHRVDYLAPENFTALSHKSKRERIKL